MNVTRKTMVLATIIIFLGSSVLPGIAGADNNGIKENKSIELSPLTNNNDPPNACWTCSDYYPDLGETVTFDGSCSEGEALIYIWFYTTPDNEYPVQMGMSGMISYSWNEPGIYYVTLRVCDYWNNIDDETKTIQVAGSPESWVSITAPDGGEHYEDEDEIKIRWSLYYPYYCLPLFDIYYQKQGQSWIRALYNAESPTNEGNVYWMWDISELLEGSYKIRIDMKHCDGGGVVASDTSDDWFYIESSQPPPPPDDPDLDCSGSLSWSNVKADSLVTGSFTVRNIGDSGSQLNWKIESFPSWGEWTITPKSGSDLSPNDEPVTVEVFVVAPDIQESTFSGEILVINEDDSSDYETISVSLSTPKDKGIFHPLYRVIEKLYPNNQNIFSLLRYMFNF